MIGKKVDFTDFLYISVRLKILAAKNLTYDGYERMINAKSSGEAESVLAECGYGAGAPYDSLLSEELRKYYSLIRSHSPDSRIVDFFLYFYDCRNLKFLVKSEIHSPGGNCPGKHLFTEPCAISYETAFSAVRGRDFSPYMPNVDAGEIIRSFDNKVSGVEYAVIFLVEEYAGNMRHILKEYESRPLPAIITIPGGNSKK